MRVDDEVLKVLDSAHVEGQCLFLDEQLSRALYRRTDEVLNAAGGTWDRFEGAHIFKGSAADAIDQIILTGEVTVPQDFGYFPTPPGVVDTLIALAGIEPGMTVLEPSAGKGAIVIKLLQRGAVVDAIELLPENVADLRRLSTDLNLIRNVEQGDFLATTACGHFDRIVMNPPFAKQADIHHVVHALNYLKIGGRLVAVMAAGVRFRENKLAIEFRALVERHGGYFVELPKGSFKESGTMVNTVIVVFPADKVE
jgi:predicted RNA methylase